MFRISFPRFSYWLGVLALILLISSGFGLATTPPPAKSFQVAQVGKAISSEKKATLLKFYRAIHGLKAKPSSIKIAKVKGGTWLVFQGNEDGSPAMAIELKQEGGFYAFGPNSAKNTCAGNPCSYCKWESGFCQCHGQGEDCNHIQGGIKDVGGKPLQVLGIGG